MVSLPCAASAPTSRPPLRLSRRGLVGEGAVQFGEGLGEYGVGRGAPLGGELLAQERAGVPQVRQDRTQGIHIGQRRGGPVRPDAAEHLPGEARVQGRVRVGEPGRDEVYEGLRDRDASGLVGVRVVK